MTATITGVNVTTTKGEVRPEKSGEMNIEANTISSWGTDTIVCTFIIDADAETGDWNLIVTRGYDDMELELADAFTITAPMTLTSISPPRAVRLMMTLISLLLGPASRMLRRYISITRIMTI